VVARMAGPAEDHAAAEITADADHVGTMISAAGEPRVVRVALVLNAMIGRAGTMDRGVMIGRVTTGMSVALLAVTIARAVMMIGVVGERRVVTAAHVTNAMTDRAEMTGLVMTGMSVALLAVTISRAVSIAEMIDRAATTDLGAKTDPVMTGMTARAKIRDRAAVSGTVQLRPHRSVRAIRIRSVPSRSKCLAKFANQTLMPTWCFPTCCASSASWAGMPVSRPN